VLSAGARLGPYEVLSPLGAGGMGEVYRARDTKLGRDVALKVLPEAFTADPDRLARFEREAKVLASLNHPHIAQIYGLEEAGGQKALVLELVEGPTLADRIGQGSIPLDEALPIARQIAEALEAAHEQGIIHRDLKPANVKVRPDGTVKVLDFGLAKAFEADGSDPDASHSPTLTARATQMGVILGTAAYMSPEQARGKPVDKRADVWAFGVVLYEMLTGRRPFAGEDVSLTLAEVMKSEPDWSRLPPTVGPRAREVLTRCLEKDPSRRYHDIADVRLDFERIDGDPLGGRPEGPLPAAGKGRAAVLAWTAAGFALGAVVAGVAVRGLMPAPLAPAPRPVQFTFEVPPAGWQVMTALSGRLAMSTDGTMVAYVGPLGTGPERSVAGGAWQLYLRRVAESEATAVPGTEGARAPFFSPDGEWVGFLAGGKLQKAPVGGGRPLEICRVSGVFGASWGGDDRIVFGGGMGSGLMTVPAAGGDPEPLTTPDAGRGEVSHGFPDFLPDGETVLFAIGTGQGSRLARLSVKTGKWEELLPHGSNPRYLRGGRLVFSEKGNLRLARFDAQAGAVAGPVLPVVDDVRWDNGAGLEETQFAVSRRGDLVFVPGGLESFETEPTWVDRRGAESRFEVDRAFYFRGRVSPDGRRVAMARAGEAGVGEIWLTSVDGRQARPIAVDGADYNPLWTPDGTRLTYTSNGNLFEKSVDRDEARSTLLISEDYLFPQSWSRDGRTLAVMRVSPKGSRLWTMPRDGQPEPFLDASFNSGSAQFSPRADLIAYVSDESGRREVYVRSFPGAERGRQVSSGGGRQPVWSADGRELFFRRGEQMLAVRVTTEPEPSIGVPTVLWERPYFMQQGLWPNYDVAPDGRFLMLKVPPAAETRPVSIQVVLDWLAQIAPRMKETR
jgi:hypothetical protein